MNVRDTVVMALRTMRASKLRTALTAIGITIGVAAVIILVGLGNGMQDALNRNTSKTSVVFQVNTTTGSVPGARITKRLTDDDAEALLDKSRAPALKQVVPQFFGAGVIRIGENTANVTVFGSPPGFLDINSQEMAVGSVYTEEDSRVGARVTVLGQGLVDLLFAGNANAAIGQQVTIGRLPFRVVGVLKRTTVADRFAYMPLRTSRSVLLGGINRLTLIGVTARNVAEVPVAMAQTAAIMDEQHDIREPGLRDYVLNGTLLQVQRIKQYLGYLKTFTIAIAGIALLVGAVGVANIMLISVHERRREIGTRRAVGARRSAIVRQLLAESTVIAGLGGIAGVVLGVGGVLFAAGFLPSRFPDFGIATVSIPAVVIAFTVSLVIGLVAGVAPAWRAARLQPVDALRS